MYEIIDKRTYFSKTFKLDNNQLRFITNKLPLHYKNDNDMLLDIENILEIDDNEDIIAYKLPYRFKLHKTGIGFTYISRKLGLLELNLSAVTDYLIEDRKYVYTIDKNIITFNDIVDGLDIIFKLMPHGVKTYRLLKTEVAPRLFTWKVKSKDNVIRLLSNSIFGYDDKYNRLDLTSDLTYDDDITTIVESWSGKVYSKKVLSNNVTFPVLIDPTITEEIAANTNDVSIFDGSLDISSLSFGVTDVTLAGCGFKFTSVPVNQGSTITNATLRLNITGNGGATDYASGLIYGYDTDSADDWQDGVVMPDNVARTSASTILPRPTGNGIVAYNVTNIVQEIINRPGWASNNHLSIVALNQESFDAATQFEDFNAAGTDEASLEITYDAATTESSGNIPLFISGYILSSGTLPLFIQGIGVSSGEIPLYLHSPAPSGEIPLFIHGYAISSGELPLFTMAASFSSGELPLFMDTYGTSSGNLDLFIHGYTYSSGELPLYTGGHISSSGGLDLYIEGYSTSSGSIPLFIWAPTPNTDTMNLYTLGGLEPGTQSSGNFPLFTWSTTNSGVLGAINLYLENTQNFIPANAMNLVLGAVEYETLTGSMNLVAYQNTTVSGDALSLFLGNYYGGLSGNIPLFMSAPSGTLGATPLSGTMNLYIERQYEGNYSSLPLFLDVAELESGSLPLYIAGETTSNNSLNLFMSGVHNPLSTLQLFTHGYG